MQVNLECPGDSRLTIHLTKAGENILVSLEQEHHVDYENTFEVLQLEYWEERVKALPLLDVLFEGDNDLDEGTNCNREQVDVDAELVEPVLL